MRGTSEPQDDGASFARLLHAARKRKHYRQEEVWTGTTVSRATYGRWERGEIDNPIPAQVLDVCRFLDINPALAFVALGWLDPDDLARAANTDTSEYDKTVRRVGRILRNREIPAAQRAALDHAVKATIDLWAAAVAMPEPHEPNGAELANGREANHTR